MTDMQDWYKGLPLLTKYWFTSIIVLPLSERFGIISGNWLYLFWDLFFTRCQIWRAVTATFAFQITPNSGFHYLITCYFIYNYSRRLEEGYFSEKKADYAFMLFFCWINCIVLALLFEIPLLLDMSMFVVLYVWCMVNRSQIVSFWFGTKFQAQYFPWILLAFHLIINGSFMSELCGIAVGHLYFFLKVKYPLDFGGMSLIETPRIFYKYFPSVRRSHGFSGSFRLGRDANAAPEAEQQQGGRHAWGAGRRLDD